MELNKKYKKNDKGIFLAENYESIKYNDGDEHEEYINNVFSRIDNFDSGSNDFKRYIKDWPSRYHLSKQRINLINPFEELLRGKKILEIGSGFGAITRRLGEISKELVSLEGSLRRATVQQKRIKDLQNVKIIVDNFKHFEIDSKFDAILSIGVLEYSNMFYDESNAALKFLNKVVNHLDENGIFMLAIENRLGLKYFSGGLEDHTNKAMIGIENTYETDGPITYGRKELEELLRESGFNYINFYFPFPDYKLPNVIFGEKSINTKKIDIRSLIQRARLNDYLIPNIITFDTFNALESININGLSEEFSNSFFVLASKNHIEFDNANKINIFTTGRKKEYQKNITIDLSDLKDITIYDYDINTSHAEKFYGGNIFILELFKIVKRESWSINELILYWEKYLRVLEIEVGGRKLQKSDTLDPIFSEFMPSNLMINENLGTHYFDKEIISTESISVGYLLFRAQIHSYNSVVDWRNCIDHESQDLYSLIRRVQNEIFETSDFDFQYYCELEDKRQLILGTESKSYSFMKSQSIKSRHYLDVYKHQKSQIEDLQQIIHGMKNSISWKVTQPIRSLKKLLNRKLY
jgi:SAM-dependent methyltransferase